MTPAESWPNGRPSATNFAASPDRADAPPSSDIRQGYRTKQHELDKRRPEVETLEAELAAVCADIVENGSNTEKVHHARLLGTKLMQAQRTSHSSRGRK